MAACQRLSATKANPDSCRRRVNLLSSLCGREVAVAWDLPGGAPTTGAAVRFPRCRCTLETAWARLVTLSLRNMRCKWFLTVNVLMSRINPISTLVLPLRYPVHDFQFAPAQTAVCRRLRCSLLRKLPTLAWQMGHPARCGIDEGQQDTKVFQSRAGDNGVRAQERIQAVFLAARASRMPCIRADCMVWNAFSSSRSSASIRAAGRPRSVRRSAWCRFRPIC